jgi:hypothetical protein
MRGFKVEKNRGDKTALNFLSLVSGAGKPESGMHCPKAEPSEPPGILTWEPVCLRHAIHSVNSPENALIHD